MGNQSHKIKMKLSATLLLASANASTLFGPIYESVANTLVSQITGILRTQAETGGLLESPAALADAVNSFADSLDGMDRSALVDLMTEVDIASLYDADGNFNTDALASVFDSADLAPLAADLQTQFMDNFLDTVEKQTDMADAMNAFLDLSTVFTDILNSDIQPSNFVAIFNDFTTGLTKFDDAFGNQLLGSTTNTIVDVTNIASSIGEKALVVYETFTPIQESFQQAQLVVDFAFQNTVEKADGYDAADGLWCTKAKHGIIDAEKEFFEFVADVAVPNYKVPVMSAFDLWNDFMHGIDFLDGLDFTENREMLEAMFDQVVFYSEAAASSLQEINILASPFNAQIKNTLEGMFC